MIYVHKILPFFLLPFGISLLLMLGGLVLRRRALCWIGVAVLWVASTPLVGDAALRAAEGWQVRRPVSAMPESQAIVVLSGGRVQPPGDPTVSEWGDPDRFYGGVDLYKGGRAPLLVFTGGWAPWLPNARLEGEVLINYAADLGVPRERMTSTARVTNTDEEARAVAAILAERFGVNPAPKILLVTSAFQMRRAVMLFSRAGVDVVPFPVDFKVPSDETFTVLNLLPGPGSLGRTEVAMRELYGFLYYRFLSP